MANVLLRSIPGFERGCTPVEQFVGVRLLYVVGYQWMGVSLLLIPAGSPVISSPWWLARLWICAFPPDGQPPGY